MASVTQEYRDFCNTVTCMPHVRKSVLYAQHLMEEARRKPRKIEQLIPLLFTGEGVGGIANPKKYGKKAFATPEEAEIIGKVIQFLARRPELTETKFQTEFLKIDKKNFAYYHAKTLYRHFERCSEIYKRTEERSVIKSGIRTPQKGDSHFVESEYTSRYLTPSSDDEVSELAYAASQIESDIKNFSIIKENSNKSHSDSSGKSSKFKKSKILEPIIEEDKNANTEFPEFPYFTLASIYKKVMSFIGKINGNGQEEMHLLLPYEEKILESLSVEDIAALKRLGSNSDLEKSFSISSDTIKALKNI